MSQEDPASSVAIFWKSLNSPYRCTSYHAELRPDLLSDVIPTLDRLGETVSESPVSEALLNEEVPAHLVCPITQVLYMQTKLSCCAEHVRIV